VGAESTEPLDLPAGSCDVLLLHGLFGSPAELRPLGEYLHARGYTVLAPLLAGHGGPPEPVARADWRAWLASAAAARRALAARCDRVIVGGLSMGAALAFYLAAETPPAGVVAMSALVSLGDDPRLWLLPLARHLLRWVYPLRRLPLEDPATSAALRSTLEMRGIPPDDAAAVARFAKSYRLPLESVYQLDRLLGRVRRVLPQVQAPTLLLQGRQDRLVPADSMVRIRALLGTRTVETRWFERSGHVLPRDCEADAVCAHVAAFVGSRMGAPVSGRPSR
jgi:carboxylesterase